MVACKNRVDGGFGPYTSPPLPHTLTTCFDDVLLEPLGGWLFLLFFVVSSITMKRVRKRQLERLENPIPLIDSHHNQSKPSLTHRIFLSHGGTYPRTRIFLLYLTTFILIALLAMHALEIARLSTNHNGVGSLPSLFFPLLVVLGSLYLPFHAWGMTTRNKVRLHGVIWTLGTVVWAVWMCITVGVKLWSYSVVKRFLGTEGYDGIDSQYKYSDRLIDNIVIICLYWSFILVYPRLIYLEYNKLNWLAFA
ncbi:hypothetical protein M231_01382 [Tremella mesenterica]|uniref:Uncharacterized protein n=1 Tax=Tremella mesenterica TaxID=5217 RepID=A0A4Q1BTG6_TREME|nr:hypothetical protein M231_01382 [Tremella mesenterica]